MDDKKYRILLTLIKQQIKRIDDLAAEMELLKKAKVTTKKPKE